MLCFLRMPVAPLFLRIFFRRGRVVADQQQEYADADEGDDAGDAVAVAEFDHEQFDDDDAHQRRAGCPQAALLALVTAGHEGYRAERPGEAEAGLYAKRCQEVVRAPGDAEVVVPEAQDVEADDDSGKHRQRQGARQACRPDGKVALLPPAPEQPEGDEAGDFQRVGEGQVGQGRAAAAVVQVVVGECRQDERDQRQGSDAVVGVAVALCPGAQGGQGRQGERQQWRGEERGHVPQAVGAEGDNGGRGGKAHQVEGVQVVAERVQPRAGAGDAGVRVVFAARQGEGVQGEGGEVHQQPFAAGGTGGMVVAAEVEHDGIERQPDEGEAAGVAPVEAA